MACHWNDLGKVTAPGSYFVNKAGKIEILPEEIGRVADLGSNPRLALEDVLVRTARERNYVIRFMRPDPMANIPTQPLTKRYS